MKRFLLFAVLWVFALTSVAQNKKVALLETSPGDRYCNCGFRVVLH